MSEAGDYRLRVLTWPCEHGEEPVSEYFRSCEHRAAIDRAQVIAGTWPDVSRVQVVDAWGMLIAQFCARAVYAPGTAVGCPPGDEETRKSEWWFPFILTSAFVLIALTFYVLVSLAIQITP